MEAATLEAHARADVLYALVRELLDDAAEPALKLADLLFTVAHAERLLQHDEAVLGLTPVALRGAMGLGDERTLQQQREIAGQVLLGRIEDKLRSKCADICETAIPMLLERTAPRANSHVPHGPKDDHDSDDDGDAAMSTRLGLARQVPELPALIIELRNRRLSLERHGRELRELLAMRTTVDLARLQAMIATTQRILRVHKQHEQPRVLEAKLRWLRAYSEAMRLRTRIVTNQVLIETYPPEDLAVLCRLREALDERRRVATAEREELRARLHLYETADREYQAIAREYGTTRHSIAEKHTWIQSLETT